jgi:hypothetical protein
MIRWQIPSEILTTKKYFCYTPAKPRNEREERGHYAGAQTPETEADGQ